MKKRKTWRCFHCDEVFRSVVRAELHFGTHQGATAVCQLDPVKFREMEAELAKYREEDTDLHRQIRSMECQHQQAIRKAEEDGYRKGLHDNSLMNELRATKVELEAADKVIAHLKELTTFSLCRRKKM